LQMHEQTSAKRALMQAFPDDRKQKKARAFDTTLPIHDQKGKQRRHRLIEEFYSRGKWSLEVQRVAELGRYFRYVYGNGAHRPDGGDIYYVLPDDDAGREDALIMCRAYMACPVNVVEIRRAYSASALPLGGR
jgi:hypothetical protein